MRVCASLRPFPCPASAQDIKICKPFCSTACAAALLLVLQAWQPLPGSDLLVTAGKDGRVLVYDTSLFADPDEEGMPKFSAPIAVAPEPQPDEATALVWSAAGDARLIYVAHTSGETSFS
jgi:hypothetical protein